MTSPTPFDLGPAHIVGIGGIGMSGIADVMLTMGYQVQGSDISESANVQRLREKGAKVFIGHKGENVKGAGTVIISSAIRKDNPEVLAARAAGMRALAYVGAPHADREALGVTGGLPFERMSALPSLVFA